MRKCVISLFCVLCFIPIVAYAHSGGTDSSGGHWNHSTGEYHYHHGYSAHQHTDMNGDGTKDCPYDFEDNKTDTPQYKIDIQIPTIPEITEPTLSEYNQKIVDNINNKNNEVDSSGGLWLLIMLWGVSIPNILYFRYNKDKLLFYLMFVGLISFFIFVFYLPV